MDIVYKVADETKLDEIEELWEELNQIHFENSKYFQDYYFSYTFNSRKDKLYQKAHKGKLLLIIAYDNNTKIGYCAASILDNKGEIDSIYIKNKYRGKHIGSTLLEKALGWLRSHNPNKISVSVVNGNEKSFEFYSKFGFKPKFHELEIVAD